MDPTSEQAIQDAAGKALMFALGALFCCIPLAIFAIQRGDSTLKTIRETGAGQQYRSNALGAVIIGYVVLAAWVAAIAMKIAEHSG